MPLLNTFPDNAWTPLESILCPELIGQFMFMGVFRQDGVNIHLYKHIETRKYINVDTSGQSYVYRPGYGEEGRYDPVPIERIRAQYPGGAKAH